ncbi:hypothetical protein, partial [Pseudomonas sp. MWU12-2115]|uniref:hypothetical protein n=1 Tax=Pseudomonas sp. MWU12-2115 TaxID=2071713 RepID=UPI003F92867C
EIIQKTAGGGGFIGYVALAPKQDVAVWVGLTRTGGTHYQNMSGGVNKLVTSLSGYQPVSVAAPARVRAKPVKAKAHAVAAQPKAKTKAKTTTQTKTTSKTETPAKTAHKQGHIKKTAQ